METYKGGGGGIWFITKRTKILSNSFLRALQSIARYWNRQLLGRQSMCYISHHNIKQDWRILFKCDMGNKELIIVGVLNCDVNKVPLDSQTHKLQTLSSLYQLTQVSNDPTRLVTETTSTLIDLILTNKAENISYFRALVYYIWAYVIIA